jgi:hypothetical protein
MPKLLYALFIIELAGTVAALALFGIADPNLFRTDFWQIGSDYGFNSSPLEVLYAYANYRPIPKIPFVWSQSCVSQGEMIWQRMLTNQQANHLQCCCLGAVHVRPPVQSNHVRSARLVSHPLHHR